MFRRCTFIATAISIPPLMPGGGTRSIPTIRSSAQCSLRATSKHIASVCSTRSGLFHGDDVVVYDNAHGFRAARLVWFLRFLGIDRVALLNASYDDWKAQAFTIDSVSTTSTTPTVDPQAGYYLVTEQLLARLDDPHGAGDRRSHRRGTRRRSRRPYADRADSGISPASLVRPAGRLRPSDPERTIYWRSPHRWESIPGAKPCSMRASVSTPP